MTINKITIPQESIKFTLVKIFGYFSSSFVKLHNPYNTPNKTKNMPIKKLSIIINILFSNTIISIAKLIPSIDIH